MAGGGGGDAAPARFIAARVPPAPSGDAHGSVLELAEVGLDSELFSNAVALHFGAALVPGSVSIWEALLSDDSGAPPRRARTAARVR